MEEGLTHQSYRGSKHHFGHFKMFENDAIFFRRRERTKCATILAVTCSISTRGKIILGDEGRMR